MEWQKTSQCLALCQPHFSPVGPNNKDYIHSPLTVALQPFSILASAECSVFLPPVLSVKLWKGQMGSGGQFLQHLNTQNCVGCLQWSGGAGSKTQSDRPRSRHKGRELWAELWRGAARPRPGSLIHYLFVGLYMCACIAIFVWKNSYFKPLGEDKSALWGHFCFVRTFRPDLKNYQREFIFGFEDWVF